MSEKTQPYKGSRDFYPEDKRFQKWMFGTIRSVVERFGYEEYDAPVLESTNLYLMKGNDEIISEQSYTFEDRGGRSVTMRTEMTPSVSRMIAAKRQEIAYPARWYSMPNLWRYERPQKGRLREFWQPNVDIFGVSGIEADFEIIQVADTVMQAFRATRSMYTIKLNSRLFIDMMLREYVGLEEVETDTMRRLIDRKAKMEPAAFIAALEAVMTPALRERGAPERLLDVLNADSLEKLPDGLAASPTLEGIQKLMRMFDKNGISNAVFDPTLMRGFDYYSDIVFEIFDNDPENNRSMFGGGRYDGLVGLFGVEPLPSVGFAMGDATLENFIRAHGLGPDMTAETSLYVVLAGDVFEELQPVLEELREEGVKVAVDTTGRKVGKQIESAAKKGAPYVMVVGQEELASGQFKLKDLKTGIEEEHSIARIISTVLAK